MAPTPTPTVDPELSCAHAHCCGWFTCKPATRACCWCDDDCEDFDDCCDDIGDECYPTSEPTENPTEEPSTYITYEPTNIPTEQPSEEPSTEEPTSEPTGEPTEEPTPEPSDEQVEEPTAEPTSEDDAEEEETEIDSSIGSELAPTGSCLSWISDDLDMCGKRVQTAIESEICWCDYLCTRLEDCCDDFMSVCEDYVIEEGDETLYKWRLEYVALEIRIRAMLHDLKIIPDQMLSEIQVLAERDAISERIAIKDHIHNSMVRRRFRR